ncbi:hypothetical protein [Gordonia aichiensis]|uniref:Uncharacterized protein n=1 Tax=Gordonia aichiensis NBRC 108223 TaxID=1220583 RepID=L7KRH6_9ACTN|nr:hypothetical protein [Gordonia aichiensis]GAC50323.1 hypothetical protein GOACH_23_00320 [Gordonia aichiensis NBRC 108223]
MDGQGCWSTVVCSAEERRALGLSGSSEWLLQCRLAAGHAGNHASDASTAPRSDRRLWLEWNDFDDRAQSLIERNPCPVPSPEGARCVFFNGHGGPHFYARSNGHAPTPPPGTNGVRRAAAPPRPVGMPESDAQHRGPSTGDLPIAAGSAGSHRLDDPREHSVREASPAAHSLPSRPIAGQPHSQSPVDATAHAYRGGRRSTNAEPPSTPVYRANRHQAVDVAGARSVEPPPPISRGHDPLPAGRSAPPAQADPVSDALREVAAALSKLADALNRARS